MDLLENTVFTPAPIDLEFLLQTIGGHLERRHRGWVVSRLVGHLALPSGAVLRVRSSKASAASLLTWMAFVDPSLAGVRWLRRVPDATGEGDIAALATRVFFSELFDALARQGVARRYRREPVLASVIRGGIDFPALARMGGNLSKLPCRVWERLPDTPLNRLVAAAIDVVSRSPTLRPGFQKDLGRARAAFAGVSPVASVEALAGHIAPDRNESAFSIAYALARIIVRGIYLGEGDRISTRGFLINLEALFERTVVRSLALAGVAFTPKARLPYTRVGHDGTESKGAMEADVVLHDPIVGPVVIDAKYKSSISSANLQQMVAYCSMLGARVGVLVVPEGQSTDLRTFHFGLADRGRVALHVIPLRTSAQNANEWSASAEQFVAGLRSIATK